LKDRKECKFWLDNYIKKKILKKVSDESKLHIKRTDHNLTFANWIIEKHKDEIPEVSQALSFSTLALRSLIAETSLESDCKLAIHYQDQPNFLSVPILCRQKTDAKENQKDLAPQSRNEVNQDHLHVRDIGEMQSKDSHRILPYHLPA